jgi:RNA polymerase sigma-54 factor
MKLDFNLQTSQRQGIALTAQVQQAIRLLQMTNLELCEFVEEQIQDNPFLDDTKFSETVKVDLKDNPSIKELDKSIEANPYEATIAQSKTSQENQFETGDSYNPRSTVAKERSDFDAIALVANDEKSLFLHCEEFCKTLDLTPVEYLIASKLIENLEPTGWLGSEFVNVAAELQVNTELVENVLCQLQSIEPAGLFARNLKECLTLQAIDCDIYSETMEVLLENLHLLSRGKFDLLKRRCGCNDKEIACVLKQIKSLDPKPGLKFANDNMIIREPDLIVMEAETGDWTVGLNNSTLPEVRISINYAKEIKQKAQTKVDKEFVQEKISEAKWLKSAIQKRNDTMLRVGAEIIKRQTDFLQKGPEHIQPMILNDIAQSVDMHESTISRVTTGTLIATPRGTLTLKTFFSVGIDQGNGGGQTSAASIRYHVKKLIAEEKPAEPISDELLVEILANKGIDIARRTVAKYRKLENIPSSFARKRRNIIDGLTN